MRKRPTASSVSLVPVRLMPAAGIAALLSLAAGYAGPL
jgi:hypothetical protein